MNEHEPVELPIDGTLDLHAFQPSEVKDLVPHYIAECRERGILQVRIIHGKGTGTMREIVRSILARLPGVSSFRLAQENGGGWGATIAFLMPKEKIRQRNTSARETNHAPATYNNEQPSSKPELKGQSRADRTHAGDRKGTIMKQHVTICAALHIAFSLMGIIAGLIVWVTIAGGGLLSGEWEAIAITSGVAIAITSFLFILSIPGLIGGLALLKSYNWARILVLVIGCLELMNIPFGTMLGVYTIWVLTNDETVRLFTAGSGATPTGT